MATLVITRDVATGHAVFAVQTTTRGQGTGTGSRPSVHLSDPRDVPYKAWCDAHRHQLRRMVRYVRARLTHTHGEGVGSRWDWGGVAASLARYAYATSSNRRKATPSIAT